MPRGDVLVPDEPPAQQSDDPKNDHSAFRRNVKEQQNAPPEIDLIEALSRQALTDRLGRLTRRDWRLEALPARTAVPIAALKRKSSSVGDAVVSALAEADGDLRYCEIHLAVESVLGGPVSRSSVKNYLARGCDRPRAVFERVGRGRYRLRRR
jgi:hypothetical protein